MAVTLLRGMKVSPLLVQRTVTRTIELQETICKGHLQREEKTFQFYQSYYTERNSNFVVKVSNAVKKHHDNSNFYEGKHLVSMSWFQRIVVNGAQCS
ncbi:hypothetical protein STEG23_012964, partial [Scotinomys teguina]